MELKVDSAGASDTEFEATGPPDFANPVLIENSGGVPEITEEVVNKINNDYEILRGRHHWQIDGNICIKILFHLYYFLMGLIVVLLFLLPLLLLYLFFLLLVLKIYLLTCCFKCKSICCCCPCLFGNNKDLFKNVNTFGDLWKLFIGTQRIRLSLTEESKRGIFWRFWNNFIITYQFFEFSKAGVEPNQLKLIRPYQRLFSKDCYPFMEGIGIDNYNEIYKEIHNNNFNRDNGLGVGYYYHSNVSSGYCLCQTLSSQDGRHRVAREILDCLLDNYSDDNIISEEERAKRENLDIIEWINSKMNNKAKTSARNQAYYRVGIFYQFFEKNPEDWSLDELKLFSSSVSALSSVIPASLHFYLGYNGLLRKLYKDLHNTGQVIKSMNPQAYTKVENYCNRYKINVNAGLLILAEQVAFIGGTGEGRKLYTLFLDKNSNKKEREVQKQFIQENGESWVKEFIRFGYGTGSSTFRSNSKRKYKIGNKEYVFPKGTVIGVPPALATNDASVYDKPDTFNINRDWDKYIGFNVLDRYHNHGDEHDVKKISLRYCPGRPFVLRAMQNLGEHMLLKQE